MYLFASPVRQYKFKGTCAIHGSRAAEFVIILTYGLLNNDNNIFQIMAVLAFRFLFEHDALKVSFTKTVLVKIARLSLNRNS